MRAAVSRTDRAVDNVTARIVAVFLTARVQVAGWRDFMVSRNISVAGAGIVSRLVSGWKRGVDLGWTGDHEAGSV